MKKNLQVKIVDEKKTTLLKRLNKRNVFCQTFHQCEHEYVHIRIIEKQTKSWMSINNQLSHKIAMNKNVQVKTVEENK